MMMANVLVGLAVASIALLGGVAALDNGLGLTPAMGYNTWNDYRCSITAADIQGAADSIVQNGLDKLGYVYINMDDCWAHNRQSNGTIVPDAGNWPQGIAGVGDYIHARGLKFGIYTDRGTLTCAVRPGSLGYEKIDAEAYASWGVDYLKEDSCYASPDHSTAFKEYGAMRDALNATGRHIYFSLCGWNPWYAPEGAKLGNSWRIFRDVNSWAEATDAINTNAPLAKYAGPGAWNDPDMLMGSSSTLASYLTPLQSRTQFSMWAIMAAPLLLGTHNLSAWDLQTYSNTEVIAVDQDSLGKQGERVVGDNLVGGSLTNGTSASNVWVRTLAGGDYAVIFINNGATASDITCDATCFQSMSTFASTDLVLIRDLWAHQVVASTTPAKGYVAQAVPANGGSTLVRIVRSSSQ